MMKKCQIPLLCAMLSLTLADCNYTVLRDDSTEEEQIRRSTGMLPDLAITRITTTTKYEYYMDSGYGAVTRFIFLVQVRNIGQARFDGSLLVAFADNEADIQTSHFPLSGDVEARTLASGDSTIINVQSPNGSYPSGTRVRFLLRADDYPPNSFYPKEFFGQHQTQELSLQNNVRELVIF